MKVNKKISITAAKTGLYSFKLCTVGKVHAVKPVDNNKDKFISKPEVQLGECLGGRKNEKRTHSATLTKNASTRDSSKMTSFDFFSKQIR